MLEKNRDFTQFRTSRQIYERSETWSINPRDLLFDWSFKKVLENYREETLGARRHNRVMP